MPTQHASGDLFEQAMTLARDAFASRQFSVAYHLLAAAYHCACHSKNESQLHIVERAALEQLKWIDANASDYEHSTKSATSRRHTSIFLILSQQAAIKSRYTVLVEPPRS